jgi:hypothetical protein
MIYGMGLVWDGTKYSTASDAGRNCGHLIVNYRMARLFVMIAIHFI